jgi:hypothetical protein
MWSCTKCGEVHEDQFEICWKCASKEMEEHVVAGEPPPRTAPSPAPEPRLRSGGSILVRMGIAFVVGAVMGGAAFYAFVPDLGGMTLLPSVWSGIALAILVGIHFWVIFPYEPGNAPRQSAEQQQDEPAS